MAALTAIAGSGFAGALRDLVALAEERPIDHVVDDIDPASREIISRLQSLAAFAEAKRHEANAIARDLARMGAEIKHEIEQVIDASRAARVLATQIARGELDVRPSATLPKSFAAALASVPAAALLRVPADALIEINQTHLVGTVPA